MWVRVERSAKNLTSSSTYRTGHDPWAQTPEDVGAFFLQPLPICSFDLQFRHNSSLNRHFCGMWSSPRRKHSRFGFIAFSGCNDLTKCMPLSAGELLKLLACLSATSIANAISTVVFHVRLFSAQSPFWICLHLRPQMSRFLRNAHKCAEGTMFWTLR